MAMDCLLEDFILTALKEDQRIDGRRAFDLRSLHIKLREDGAVEVQLGQTRVMCVVSGQLVKPYPDHPNEGILSVYTEFSPMADPAFETGRPGESAVELGRIIDRVLRESRAVDTESLCVLAGKAVWSLRIDICILDNGGNLIDSANMAALAALLSFHVPDCSLGGVDAQEVVIHPPEMREPLRLTVHYLPVAMTFAFLGDGTFVVMDPSYIEELIMKGRMTVMMNVHGDICAIQKGGGIGVSFDEVRHCVKIANTKVADITARLRKAVELYEMERAEKKIRRHRSVCLENIVVSNTKSSSTDSEMRQPLFLELNANTAMSDTDDSTSSGSDDSTEEQEEEDTAQAFISLQRLSKAKRSMSSTDSTVKQGNEIGTSLSVASTTSLAAFRTVERVSPEAEATILSQRLEKVDIESRKGDAGDRKEPFVRQGKPLTLLDAVKRKNLRKKKG